jgi:hypothetical protein
LKIEEALVIFRHKSVKIYECMNLLWYKIRHTGDDHAPVRMAHENEIVEILPLDDIDDILDVGVKIDGRIKKMGTLAETGVGRCEHGMSVASQRPRYPPIIPPAVPCPMGQ